MDTFTTFLTSSFDERIAMLGEPDVADKLRTHLGSAAVDEYLTARAGWGRAHLATSGGTPVVFVPGVMGSVLVSQGLSGTWWIDPRTRHHLDHLRLTPDGLDDHDPRAKIAPVAVDPVYDRFLCAIYDEPGLRPVPFWYDWRKPLSVSTPSLAAKIRDAAAGGTSVHLVAHSMGGLIVRTTLMECPDLWPLIGRIVFIGTPHYGAPAIASYLKRHLWGFPLLTLLGRYLTPGTLRSMRGVLSLLPAPVGIYPDTHGDTPVEHHPCANFDLYDADAWRLDLSATDRARLQDALDATRNHHVRLYRWHLGLEQRHRNRMAAIVGVGLKTLFRTTYRQTSGHKWQEDVTRDPGTAHRDGDGRVPLASARLGSIAQTRYVRVEHQRLPSDPAVTLDVCRFLRGRTMRLARTPEAVLYGHLSGTPTPAVNPLVGRPEPLGDDPGYLEADAADTAVTALDDALARDALPEFARLSVL